MPRATDCLASAAEDLESLPPGTRVGPFQVLREIGRGGTGVVFEALQDAPLTRRVAVKVLRLSALSPHAEDRFVREQRLLARLGHPAIAQVLDTGTLADGRPWFAMEFVDGLPIDVFCRTKRVGLSERLELLAEACEAVAFAHRRGVIHRDLKPGNVLVGAFDGPVAVKVVDFGVSRSQHGEATERPGSEPLTEVGALIGTLEFMSPELASRGAQAADAQSDLYSLGALAYCVLAGGLPVEPGDRRVTPLDERLRRVRLQPAQRASAVALAHAECGINAAELRGDIDLVLARSVAKDPAERHAGAHELARDLRRLATGDAVHVPGLPATVRLARWARRNARSLTTISGISVLLGAAAAASMHAAMRESAARAEAERALQEVQQARGRTEAMVIGAWTAIGPVRNRIQFGVDSGRNVAMMRAMRDLFREVFGTESPYTDTAVREYARALSSAGNPREAAEELLAALPGWQKRGGADHPKLIQIRTDIGECLRRAGQPAQAIPILESVTRQCDEVGVPFESPVQSARRGLSICLSQVGRHDEAISTAEEALLRLTLCTPPHPMDMALMQGVLAGALRLGGRFDEAEALYRELLSPERSRTFEAHPQARLTMGVWAGELGMLMHVQGRQEEARPWIGLGLRWLHGEASAVNPTARWLRENAGCYGLCDDGSPVPAMLVDRMDP